MELRPYQQDTIFHLINSTFERECVCLPTGAGKTFIFSIFSGLMVAKGIKIVIAVHRSELMEQAKSQIIAQTGLQVGVVTAKMKHLPTTDIVVCMVETLARRKKTLAYLSENYGILIVDECHIGNFNKILAPFKRVIGFSATPLAIKKNDSLANHYHEVYVPLQLEDLIPEFLCTPEFYGHPGAIAPSEFKLNVGGTDYDEKFMGDLLSSQKFIKTTGDYVKRFCVGKRTVIYNANIAHSTLVAKHLQSLGFNAHHLDGTTPDAERKAIIGRLFTEPDCIISNVGVLTTGFDCPEIEVIILNRLTKSLSLYIQMAGRGSRNSNLISKEKFTIIDLCNNFEINGFWQEPRDWEALFKKKKPNISGIAPTKMCKGCGYIVPIAVMICPSCGYEFPAAKAEEPEDPKLVKIEFFKKELESIMDKVVNRGQNVYRGLHLIKEKIYFASPDSTLEALQSELLTQLPNWCTETGKRHNQWHKDFCNNIMKEFYDKYHAV